MPPPLFIDMTSIDLGRVQFGPEEIERINPHRGVMRMLDGIIWQNEEASAAIAYRDIKSDEFWVPGHIPGRPLFPGVLMLEAGAQLASYICLKRLRNAGTPASFLGFVGTDGVKFRDQVVPGDRLLVVGREVEFRKRRFICEIQGVVRDTLAFEAVITGMTM
jgi:3-hydroxyacyl-[acyl-carrier-protein] dehydratase